MEIYISINGVLRNIVQKFGNLYNREFIDSDTENSEDNFNYKVSLPLRNNELLKCFAFHDNSEFENFAYMDYALELFGHSGLSYMGAMNELNELIHKYPRYNFTLIGVDEFGKAKPSTLFFLSKYGFLGNNIKFISSKNIKNEWEKCDIWITDDKKIIKSCPKNKTVIKFNTEYNSHFSSNIEINKISKFNELCLKSLVQTTTSTLIKSLKNVGQIIMLKSRKRKKLPKRSKNLSLMKTRSQKADLN